MKKTIYYLAFILSLFIVSSVSAQNGSTDMQVKMKQMLKDSIQLSDAMADSVMAVHEQFQPQQRDIFMNQSLSDDDKKSQMDALRLQIHARLKTIGLTDDQIQKLDAMGRRMREQMRNNPNGGNN